MSPAWLELSSLNTSRQNSTFAVLRESILGKALPENGREKNISDVPGGKANIEHSVMTFCACKRLSPLLHEKLQPVVTLSEELINARMGEGPSQQFFILMKRRFIVLFNQDFKALSLSFVYI